MMKGPASPEHERLVKALADYFRGQSWSKNVKTPADDIRGMRPDVQCEFEGKLVYGEAKLCEDFPATDTKDQLVNYLGLGSEYKLYLVVPRVCEGSVRQTLAAWGLGHRVELKGF